MAYEQYLESAGLNKEQALLYEALIKYGPAKARALHTKVNISRPLVYKVLEQLEEMGLVTKEDRPGTVSVFTPKHPLALRDMIEKRRQSVTDAKLALDAVLGNLVSDFNALSGTPGVRIMEGVSGVAELYEDILNEHADILLVRSPDDAKFPELAALVEQQIQAQVEAGIHTRALTPLTHETPQSVLEHDSERLVERRILDQARFNTPAQIIIYANKVAVTAYGDTIMTTIIENAAIRATCATLFEYIWNASEQEHARIYDEIVSEGRAATTTSESPA